jgi:DNA-binding response OmpR family regulator
MALTITERPLRILLVSSHERVTAHVTTALPGSPDIDLVEVSTPQRALQLLDQGERYDIIIADNDTWPTGGFALSREVKARLHMGKDMPPVLLLLARDQDRWLSNWSQADAYIVKPPDPFDLAETVQALVDERLLPLLPGVGGDPAPLLDALEIDQRDIVTDEIQAVTAPGGQA